MFGPLPRLYRLLMIGASVAGFLAAGAWVGHLPVAPVPPAVGAVLGALAGVAVAWALVHDFHADAQPARADRHR